MRRSRSHPGRRSPWSLALALVGLVALVLPVSPPVGAQSSDPTAPDTGGAVDAATLREQYEELVGAEADLLVDYDLTGARLVELVLQVEAAQDGVRRADTAAAAAEADLATARQEEADADVAADEARTRVRRAEIRLRNYAVETYMASGDTDAMGAVLDAIEGDAGPLARRGYYRTVDDQQRDLIDALVEARTRSRQAQRVARTAAAGAAEQRVRVEELRTDATEALAEVSRLTAEAATERRRQEELITELRAHQVAIEARIVSLQKAADGIASLLAAFQGNDEGWVPGAVDVRVPRQGGVISSEFGQRAHPILNITRLHAGADIGAPSGSPVLAAASGIVVAVEPRGGYGNTVLISHGHSLSTVYAHNVSFEVEVGQVVEQGDLIARAGSTGLSTGPHIHFETRIKGTPVNPRSIVTAGDASWGRADPDGDGIRNTRDVAPDDPEVPVAGGAGDDDGDGQPNGGDVLHQPPLLPLPG